MPLPEEKAMAIKEKLKKAAKKAEPNDVQKQKAYVYGTLNKIKERAK